MTCPLFSRALICSMVFGSMSLTAGLARGTCEQSFDQSVQHLTAATLHRGWARFKDRRLAEIRKNEAAERAGRARVVDAVLIEGRELIRHYGINDVRAALFLKVDWPNGSRNGLLFRPLSGQAVRQMKYQLLQPSGPVQIKVLESEMSHYLHPFRDVEAVVEHAENAVRALEDLSGPKNSPRSRFEITRLKARFTFADALKGGPIQSDWSQAPTPPPVRLVTPDYVKRGNLILIGGRVGLVLQAIHSSRKETLDRFPEMVSRTEVDYMEIDFLPGEQIPSLDSGDGVSHIVSTDRSFKQVKRINFAMGYGIEGKTPEIFVIGKAEAPVQWDFKSNTAWAPEVALRPFINWMQVKLGAGGFKLL